MKKGGLNSVLIVAVLAVWAIVIYRIASGYFSSEEVVTTAGNTTTTEIPVVRNYSDTFRLHNNYRDPFLGNVSPVKIQSNSNRKSNEKEKKVEVKPESTFPKVSFIGMIKNNTNSKAMALIRINGKETRMSQGQEVDGIKLEKLYKDSCLLSRGKEKVMARHN